MMAFEFEHQNGNLTISILRPEHVQFQEGFQDSGAVVWACFVVPGDMTHLFTGGRLYEKMAALAESGAKLW